MFTWIDTISVDKEEIEALQQGTETVSDADSFIFKKEKLKWNTKIFSKSYSRICCLQSEFMAMQLEWVVWGIILISASDNS